MGGPGYGWIGSRRSASSRRRGVAFVKLDKGDFIGRTALLKKRKTPAPTKLACLVLDDPRSVALGSEPVRIAGDIAGRVTSVVYGDTLGKSPADAYAPATPVHATPIEV